MHILNSEIIKPNARLAWIKNLFKYTMLMWIYCGYYFVYTRALFLYSVY